MNFTTHGLIAIGQQALFRKEGGVKAACLSVDAAPVGKLDWNRTQSLFMTISRLHELLDLFRGTPGVQHDIIIVRQSAISWLIQDRILGTRPHIRLFLKETHSMFQSGAVLTTVGLMTIYAIPEWLKDAALRLFKFQKQYRK